MDFMFALAVHPLPLKYQPVVRIVLICQQIPVSIAGESVASRVSASLMAAMCSGSVGASLVCAMVARDADDYGMLVRRAARMSNGKVRLRN